MRYGLNHVLLEVITNRAGAALGLSKQGYRGKTASRE